MQEFFKAFIAFVEVILCITGLRPVENVANYSNTKYVPQEVTSPMAIVENGKSDFVIVTSDNPDATIITASKEMQRYIEKISGAKLSIITESNYKSEQKAIIIGETAIENDEQLECIGCAENGKYEEGYTFRRNGIYGTC